MIMGDFNVDYTNKKSLHASGLNALGSKYSITQLVDRHTRISRDSKTTIDLIYTDMNNILNSGDINYDVSDHLAVFFIKKHQRTKI